MTIRHGKGEGVATMSLGRKDHIMTWCSASKIYKVNKFHMIDTDLRSKRRSRSSIYLEDESDSLGGEKVDIIVGLLNHNMVEQAEYIFDLIGLRSGHLINIFLLAFCKKNFTVKINCLKP